MTGESHVADPFEPFGDTSGVKDLLHGDEARTVVAGHADTVVELQEIHRIHAQAFQTAAQAAFNGSRNVFQVLRFQIHLGGHPGAGLQLSEKPAERFLGFALPVDGGRIDPVDACIKGPANGSTPGVVILVNQYPAHESAAEYDFRNLEIGLAKASVADHAGELLLDFEDLESSA